MAVTLPIKKKAAVIAAALMLALTITMKGACDHDTPPSTEMLGQAITGTAEGDTFQVYAERGRVIHETAKNFRSPGSGYRGSHRTAYRGRTYKSPASRGLTGRKNPFRYVREELLSPASPLLYSSPGKYNPFGNYRRIVYRKVFKITAYTAGFESCGKRPGDPLYGVTATGTQVTEGRTIAADWAVLSPGTLVCIEGVGYREVEDRGGAVQGEHIDLYVENLDQARAWGVQYRKIWVIGG